VQQENYFRRQYDELGRLRESEGPFSTQSTSTPKPENARFQYTYDLQGRLREKRNPVTGRFTAVAYDLAGRVSTVSDSLSRITSYAYDEVGNRIGSRDGAGLSMHFEYDARGLLTRRHGQDVDDRYRYDGRGRRIAATNAVSSHRFRYDALDRVVEHYGSLMGTARFAYDELDRLQHIVYPEPPSSAFTQPAVSTYQYDPAGRVISIQDTRLAAGASSHSGGWRFAWDAVGRLSARTDPNGIQRSAKFMVEGWVDELGFRYPDGTTETLDYGSYNGLGSPGSINFGGGVSTTAGYDAVNRLDTVAYTGGLSAEQYDVDADGNRTRYSEGGSHGDRTYLLDPAHQVYRIVRTSTSVRLENFVYDGAGRLDSFSKWDEASGGTELDESTDYTYDGLGRLTRVTRGVAGGPYGYEMTLEYGPLGERIRRTEIASTGAPVVTSLYLAGLIELRDIGANGVAQTAVRLIRGPGPGGLVGEVTAAGEVRTLLADASHNVIRAAVITGAGPYTETLHARRYRPFGVVGSSTAPPLAERGFAGLVAEGQSGVVYMDARHYDPARGRFLQPDPLGIATDQLYAYAANNPLLFVDPLGLSPLRLSESSSWRAFDFGFSQSLLSTRVSEVPLSVSRAEPYPSNTNLAGSVSYGQTVGAIGTVPIGVYGSAIADSNGNLQTEVGAGLAAGFFTGRSVTGGVGVQVGPPPRVELAFVGEAALPPFGIGPSIDARISLDTLGARFDVGLVHGTGAVGFIGPVFQGPNTNLDTLTGMLQNRVSPPTPVSPPWLDPRCPDATGC
jgi:RHS repeat-associated protein